METTFLIVGIVLVCVALFGIFSFDTDEDEYIF